jgi:hypothetical protein
VKKPTSHLLKKDQDKDSLQQAPSMTSVIDRHNCCYTINGNPTTVPWLADSACSTNRQRPLTRAAS